MVAKKKLDNRDQKELEEIKQYYEQKYKNEKPEEPILHAVVSSPTVSAGIIKPGVHDMVLRVPNEYKEITKDYTPEQEEEEHHDYSKDISIITPLEFGDDMSYDTLSLTYYADDTLAYDDDDEIVDNVDDVVGIDSLKHLREYNDDCLYIRNDITHAYYEITESDKTYSEVTGRFI